MNISNQIGITMIQGDTVPEDVRRCLAILFQTRKGTVALDRDFGLDWSFLDMPTEAAKAACAAEIITAVDNYEPRASVERVTFTGTSEGVFRPIVEVSLADV